MPVRYVVSRGVIGLVGRGTAAAGFLVREGVCVMSVDDAGPVTAGRFYGELGLRVFTGDPDSASVERVLRLLGEEARSDVAYRVFGALIVRSRDYGWFCDAVDRLANVGYDETPAGDRGKFEPLVDDIRRRVPADDDAEVADDSR